MLAGDCEAGRDLIRVGFERHYVDEPDLLQAVVDARAIADCRGASMSARDRLLLAHARLEESSRREHDDPDRCRREAQTIAATRARIPRDDPAVRDSPARLHMDLTGCLARAHACDAAWAAYNEAWPEAEARAATERETYELFEIRFPMCR